MEGAGQLCLALGTSSCNSAIQPAPGQRVVCSPHERIEDTVRPVHTGPAEITWTLSTQTGAMAMENSPLTTHVLDTASGLPAQGLCLRLSRLEAPGQQWMELRTSYTNLDGRCPGLLTPGQIKPGTYKLFFDTESYWKERGQESFYPYVEVVFTIAQETQKFHVPLLLSPWSYTTYRGS
ncbi:5-hydroxyisourate hydrolase isoform X1 [Arvicola amphibius]|uniref:5-hydroxyisourate hydrolase isoform X1 n=2 Tax=Arvicola amphibius TaxID=1047088 RepID=UPI0018E33CAF|nr:5-hydroxyisourate hydrolase isoform X1 [Arvicola amphibius]